MSKNFVEHHRSMDTVAVLKALKKVHTEAEDDFHVLYRKASNMRCITETRRKCERQNIELI